MHLEYLKYYKSWILHFTDQKICQIFCYHSGEQDLKGYCWTWCHDKVIAWPVLGVQSYHRPSHWLMDNTDFWLANDDLIIGYCGQMSLQAPGPGVGRGPAVTMFPSHFTTSIQIMNFKFSTPHKKSDSFRLPHSSWHIFHQRPRWVWFPQARLRNAGPDHTKIPIMIRGERKEKLASEFVTHQLGRINLVNERWHFRFLFPNGSQQLKCWMLIASLA